MDRLSPDWEPSSFDAAVERRADGTLILTPRTALPPGPARVTDMLEHWATQAPERTLVAQRRPDGEWQRVSYSTALQRVRALAAALARLPLSAERPIAILSGNGIEHLLLSLAAMYVGVPYCPVSPAYSQPRSDLARLRTVMRLLTPGLVAAFDMARYARAIELAVPADAMLMGDLPVIAGRAVLSLAQLEAGAASEAALRARAAHAQVLPDSIAKFLLTSGSTGDPKAVITTHRMLCSNQLMLRAAIPFVAEEPPILVDWLPWHHTFGGSHNVGLVLFHGGSLFIDSGRPLPEEFEPTLRNLREISPTIYLNVPQGYELLARHLQEDALLRASFFKRLRACFFAAASLPQSTWDVLDRLSLAGCGRRIPILSGLGATETAPSVTFTTPHNDRAGVIGLPAPGCIVKLAPSGDKLELRTRGPHVTPGYWRAPELTAAAFDEEGFYRLGDAVRLRDSADPLAGLVFDGRIAEDFKLASGTWVSVGPLRTRLLASLAPVARDVVIAGANREYLTALVLPDRVAIGALLGMQRPIAAEQLAREPRLRAHLASSLGTHARGQLGSATRVRRLALLPEPPSLDQGEITDKGTLNQRRMLERWAGLVDEMYREPPPPHIVIADEGKESTWARSGSG